MSDLLRSDMRLSRTLSRHCRVFVYAASLLLRNACFRSALICRYCVTIVPAMPATAPIAAPIKPAIAEFMILMMAPNNVARIIFMEFVEGEFSEVRIQNLAYTRPQGREDGPRAHPPRRAGVHMLWCCIDMRPGG